MTEKLHSVRAKIHQGISGRQSRRCEQVHAIALAQRVYVPPADPAVSDVVVVHAPCPMVQEGVADVTAFGVIQVEALRGEGRSRQPHDQYDGERNTRKPGQAVTCWVDLPPVRWRGLDF